LVMEGRRIQSTPNERRMMNRCQTIANNGYGDDAIAQAIDNGDDAGDTLALFIGRELEDCENIDDAVRRIETARDDIDRVIKALNEEHMKQILEAG